MIASAAVAKTSRFSSEPAAVYLSLRHTKTE